MLGPFLAAAALDLPRLVSIGPVSGLGAFSVAQVLTASHALLLLGAYPRAVLARLAPFACLVAWLVARSAAGGLNQNGIQNAFVYALFGLNALLAGSLAVIRPTEMARALPAGFALLDVLVLSVAAVHFAAFGLPADTAEEVVWLVSPRGLALLAIVPISWHLSGWAHGRPGAGFRALLWLGAVLASLSRTATAVSLVAAAIACLAQTWTRPGRLVRQLPLMLAGGLLVAGLVTLYQAQFRQRFLEGFNNVEVGGVAISTSGRNHIWPVVIASAWQHPMAGGGLGSSQAALEEFDPEVIGHPHNEYLRIWHDGGFIGLSWLALAFGVWLVVLARRWRHGIRTAGGRPDVPGAAFLTVVGIMLAAITDNNFIYPYVMGPAGWLVGAALGFNTRPAAKPVRSLVPREVLPSSADWVAGPS